MIEVSDEIGSYLVTIARKAIMERVINSRPLDIPPGVPDQVLTKAGVFVTIRNHDGSKDLRGCVGVALPELPLIDSVLKSAVSAAIRDPRFLPLSAKDLDLTRIEVSVLTTPELIIVENRLIMPTTIKIGIDGLMVRCLGGSALLLPQVAAELGWDSHEFLCQASIKAGGARDVWLRPDTKVYRFQASVFEESKPGGEIVRRVTA